MSNQLRGLGTRSQDLVIPFQLGEGETLTQLHLRALHIISEPYLLQYQTGHSNKLTGK